MPQPLKVLFVEDNALDAEIVLHELRKAGFEPDVRQVDTEVGFLAHLDGSVDLVLSDFQLPVFTGARALELLQQSGRDVPFILLSGTIGEETAVAAIKQGATDYLMKDRLARLGSAVTHALAETRLRRERQHSEEALRESETRFRELAENIREVFWVSDPEKAHKLYLSPAFEEIWGRTCQSAYATPHLWLDAIRPEDRARVLHAVQTKQARGAYHEEYRIHRPDGTERWINDRAFPVRDPAGKIKRWVGIAADITESKKMQAQFLHAQRLESLGMLAAGIAHDLNNVLAPIVFTAPLLRASLSVPGDLKILDMLERSAGRGAGLVKQILGFVQSTSGEFVDLQVKHLLRDVVDVIEETFPKFIHLEEKISPDLWTVHGNATQIHQVLLNLCVNARDAMPSGGTLCVCATNQQLTGEQALALPGAHAGAWLVLEVADTGTGIPPDVLPRIWDPFFTTKGVGKGSGLGLSTVRGIVTSHLGFVTVESTPGRGTMFRVFLPALVEQAPAAGSKPVSAAPFGHSELILVVDDEKPVRDLVAAVLTRSHYRVLIAADGVEAVSHFTSHTLEIGLVITDIDMPVLGGIALGRIFAQLRPDLRLLMISGLPHDEVGGLEDPAAAFPVHAFLQKPFTFDALLSAVHHLLHSPKKD